MSQTLNRGPRLLLLGCLLWLCLAMILGCDDESQIRVYDAPADEPVPEAVAKRANVGGPSGVSLGNPGSEKIREQIEFDLPEGWHEVEKSSNIRLTTIAFGDDERQGTISITRFPGKVGTKLSNVNRWRRDEDIGLPPVDRLDQLDAKTISEQTFDKLPCTIYNIGPAKDQPGSARIVVAEISDAKFKWFIKMKGPNSLIDSQVDEFSAFMKSLRLPLIRPAQN